MRRLVFLFDAFLRKTEGVFEFTSDPNCLLRLQFATASHRLCLNDITIEKGSPILLFHLWNEHVPAISHNGVDMAWARLTTTLFINSLRTLGTLICHDPQYDSVLAIGGASVMLTHYPRQSGVKSLSRLGFTVLPYKSDLGKFGEFWENFYSFVLVWAYNNPSLRDRQLFQQSRKEIWISKADFIRRFRS